MVIGEQIRKGTRSGPEVRSESPLWPEVGSLVGRTKKNLKNSEVSSTNQKWPEVVRILQLCRASQMKPAVLNYF